MSEYRQATDAFASNPVESKQEIRNYTMNFGPQHPAAHGVSVSYTHLTLPTILLV